MNKNFFSRTLLWDASLLLVAMIWGYGFVITKNALDVITPLYFLAIRFIAAGIIMFIIFNKQIRNAEKKDFKNGCIIGVFLALAFITQTFGAKFTTPAKSSFITGLNVVLVPFILIFVTKKLPAKKAVFTALLAFGGLSLLSLNGSLSISTGDFLTFLCAIFYACHIVSVGHFAGSSDALVIASVQILFTGVVCGILALFFEPFPSIVGTATWMGIVYCTFLSTILAFLVQNVAQRNTPSSHAAIILCLESVFGAICSAIFWHEVLTVRMIIGCTLIFVAILINEVDFRSIIKGRASKTA